MVGERLLSSVTAVEFLLDRQLDFLSDHSAYHPYQVLTAGWAFFISVLVFVVLIMQRLKRSVTPAAMLFFLFRDICFYAHTFIKMSQSQVKIILEMNFSFIPPLAVITLIRDIKQIYQTYFFVA